MKDRNIPQEELEFQPGIKFAKSRIVVLTLDLCIIHVLTMMDNFSTIFSKLINLKLVKASRQGNFNLLISDLK